MECTKGEWKIHQYVQEGIWEITAGSVCIASVSDEANANLMVEAVNACQSVNPNNPIATAKAIKDLYEACKDALNIFTQYDAYNATISGISLKLNEALAKAEGK